MGWFTLLQHHTLRHPTTFSSSPKTRQTARFIWLLSLTYLVRQSSGKWLNQKIILKVLGQAVSWYTQIPIQQHLRRNRHQLKIQTHFVNLLSTSQQLTLLIQHLGRYSLQAFRLAVSTLGFLGNTMQSGIRTFIFPWRYYPLETSSFLVFLLVCMVGLYQLQMLITDLPSSDALQNQPVQFSSQVVDRSGQLLYQLYGTENRVPVSLEHISPYLLKATVAIEDQDFWSHHGFSIRGIFRALKANIDGKPVQGGSTLTQQLVKMRLLTNDRTVERKLKEIILAIQIEQRYSKTELLELYLNQVAYGGTTYGISEAAAYYFAKSPADLTLGEAALLAGLPAAPSAYTPFGSTPEVSLNRQKEVLRRMVEDNYITQTEATAAQSQPLVFHQQRHDIKAPYFVMYVIQRLEEVYGSKQLKEGGLIITTTLDYALQQKTEQVLTNEIAKLRRLHITNAAALITNPQTGEILSLVGGVDYFDPSSAGQVNVVLRPRQPGSAIKPITYAAAFEKGLLPISSISDSPIVYRQQGSQPYAPKNYDGAFHGVVTLRQALASSYNVPAVKLLAYIGVPTLIKKAQAMGITTWNQPERYGLSLTLGGGDVTMLDMATAYGVLANQGRKVMLNPIRQIETYDGKVLYQNPCVVSDCPVTQVLDPAIAYEITHILKDNKARSPAFGSVSALYIPNHEVAVKTGTTNNMRDNWTFGYTSNRLVATWVGNNDNSPMSHVASGITGASPIWNKLMTLQLAHTPKHSFPIPDSLVVTKLCRTGRSYRCGSCAAGTEEVIPLSTWQLAGCHNLAHVKQPLVSVPQIGGTSSANLTYFQASFPETPVEIL